MSRRACSRFPGLRVQPVRCLAYRRTHHFVWRPAQFLHSAEQLFHVRPASAPFDCDCVLTIEFQPRGNAALHHRFTGLNACDLSSSHDASRRRSGPIGARSSSKDAAWQSADPEGRASPEKNGNGMSAMEQHIYRLLGGSSGGGAAAAAPEAPVGNGLLDRTGDGGFPDLQRGSQPGIPQEPQPPLSSRGASGGSAQPQSPQFPQASLDGERLALARPPLAHLSTQPQTPETARGPETACLRLVPRLQSRHLGGKPALHLQSPPGNLQAFQVNVWAHPENPISAPRQPRLHPTYGVL